MNIQIVKYQAKIETPTTYTGYLVDGTKSVPMAQGNKDYRAVQEWIAKGNTPEDAYTQEELDAHEIEYTYQMLVEAINKLQVDYMGHIFSGNIEMQAYVVAMLSKIEGENPNSTRSVYSIDGRTRVPMTKSELSGLMSVIDVAQEAISGAYNGKR